MLNKSTKKKVKKREMEQSLIDTNKLFDKKLSEVISKKGQNSQILTKPAYLTMIQKVKESQTKTKKIPEDYQRLRRYDIKTIEEIERLIVPKKEENEPTKLYVHTDEIFKILHDAHIATRHGGRTRMEKKLNPKYKNVTREMIVLYLNLCKTCRQKQDVPEKNVIVKPISNSEFKTRCLVNLIDMEDQPDDEYKFILLFQDQLTKFVQLRPLQSKINEVVAYVLLDIFTIFGAPSILESENGRDFASDITKELCGMWPELKIVHGKFDVLNTEGFIERCNEDVQNMLGCWLQTNNTTKWSEGLRFVQLMKNRAFHASINCSPFEAMFGKKLKVGLRSSIPDEILDEVNMEEDLDIILNSNDKETNQNGSNSNTLPEDILDGSNAIPDSIIGQFSPIMSDGNISPYNW